MGVGTYSSLSGAYADHWEMSAAFAMRISRLSPSIFLVSLNAAYHREQSSDQNSVSDRGNGSVNLERIYIYEITLDDENVLSSRNLGRDLGLGSRLVADNSDYNIICVLR